MNHKHLPSPLTVIRRQYRCVDVLKTSFLLHHDIIIIIIIIITLILIINTPGRTDEQSKELHFSPWKGRRRFESLLCSGGGKCNDTNNKTTTTNNKNNNKNNNYKRHNNRYTIMDKKFYCYYPQTPEVGEGPEVVHGVVLSCFDWVGLCGMGGWVKEVWYGEVRR